MSSGWCFEQLRCPKPQDGQVNELSTHGVASPISKVVIPDTHHVLRPFMGLITPCFFPGGSELAGATRVCQDPDPGAGCVISKFLALNEGTMPFGKEWMFQTVDTC